MGVGFVQWWHVDHVQNVDIGGFEYMVDFGGERVVGELCGYVWVVEGVVDYEVGDVVGFVAQ